MLPLTSVDALFEERLVVELHRLGGEHLMRLTAVHDPAPLDGAGLIAALAGHAQARLRSALILLFLRQPAYSQFVDQALAYLNLPASDTLRLYYQAAVYLRPE